MLGRTLFGLFIALLTTRDISCQTATILLAQCEVDQFFYVDGTEVDAGDVTASGLSADPNGAYLPGNALEATGLTPTSSLTIGPGAFGISDIQSFSFNLKVNTAVSPAQEIVEFGQVRVLLDGFEIQFFFAVAPFEQSTTIGEFPPLSPGTWVSVCVSIGDDVLFGGFKVHFSVDGATEERQANGPPKMVGDGAASFKVMNLDGSIQCLHVSDSQALPSSCSLNNACSAAMCPPDDQGGVPDVTSADENCCDVLDASNCAKICFFGDGFTANDNYTCDLTTYTIGAGGVMQSSGTVMASGDFVDETEVCCDVPNGESATATLSSDLHGLIPNAEGSAFVIPNQCFDCPVVLPNLGINGQGCFVDGECVPAGPVGLPFITCEPSTDPFDLQINIPPETGINLLIKSCGKFRAEGVNLTDTPAGVQGDIFTASSVINLNFAARLSSCDSAAVVDLASFGDAVTVFQEGDTVYIAMEFFDTDSEESEPVLIEIPVSEPDQWRFFRGQYFWMRFKKLWRIGSGTGCGWRLHQFLVNNAPYNITSGLDYLLNLSEEDFVALFESLENLGTNNIFHYIHGNNDFWEHLGLQTILTSRKRRSLRSARRRARKARRSQNSVSTSSSSGETYPFFKRCCKRYFPKCKERGDCFVMVSFRHDGNTGETMLFVNGQDQELDLGDTTNWVLPLVGEVLVSNAEVSCFQLNNNLCRRRRRPNCKCLRFVCENAECEDEDD